MTTSEKQGPLRVKFAYWTALAHTKGSVGVTLSLLLVAWELKQSRDIAEAQLYGERLTFNSRIQLEDFDGEIAAVAMGNLFQGKEIENPHGEYHAEKYIYARFDERDLSHIHKSKGLLGADVWASQLGGWEAPLCAPLLRAMIEEKWAKGFGFRPEFAAEINAWMDSVECPEPVEAGSVTDAGE